MVLIAAALTAIQTVAPVPAPAFAPIADRPYRLLITQRRAVAGVPRRFVSERRVTFRRDGSGWVAEMLLVDVSTDLPGESGRRFVATAGALRGRPVHMHLAGDGTLVAMDEETAIGAAVATAIAAIGPGLASAAPPASRAVIAEPLMVMIAGADGVRVPGRGPVALPAGQDGGTALTGDETIAVAPGGKLRIAIVAHGAVSAGTVAITRERTIDPATGLVEWQAETRTTRIGDRSLTVEYEGTLAPVT